MAEKEMHDSETNQFEDISEEVQEISTKEIIDADYEVIPPSHKGTEETERRDYVPPMGPPPSRTYFDASIEASSDDVGGTHEGYTFTGYDSPMATRIGDETNDDPHADRLRQLHEGRHRSDGEHSIRESQRDKKRIAQAICSALPLAKHERMAVINAVQNIDFTRFGHQKGIVGVTLGVVAVVIDEHIREEKTPDSIVSWSDEFRSLCKTHDISMSDRGTIKEIVREEIEDGNVCITQGPDAPKRDPDLPGPMPPSERPNEYWENLSSDYWATVAKHWDSPYVTDKKAIPEKYRDLIDQLRNWAPWEDKEEETPEHTAQTSESKDELKLDVPLEEIEKEVEQLLGEIDEEGK